MSASVLPVHGTRLRRPVGCRKILAHQAAFDISCPGGPTVAASSRRCCRRKNKFCHGPYPRNSRPTRGPPRTCHWWLLVLSLFWSPFSTMIHGRTIGSSYLISEEGGGRKGSDRAGHSACCNPPPVAGERARRAGGRQLAAYSAPTVRPSACAGRPRHSAGASGATVGAAPDRPTAR